MIRVMLIDRTDDDVNFSLRRNLCIFLKIIQ